MSFVTVPGTSRFSGIAPATEVIAREMLAETADAAAIRITAGEIIRQKGGPP